MSDLRPPSPYERAPLKKRPARAAPSKSASVGRVLAQSFEAVRRRWLTLALLTYGLGLIPMLGLTLGFHPHYWNGGKALGLASLGFTLAVRTCQHVAIAAVTSAVVEPRVGPRGAVAATLIALPALVPIWLASEYYMFWAYWDYWTPSPLQSGRLLFASLAELAIALVSPAALGVLTPVVIAEKLSLRRAIGRCWGLMRGNRWRILALYVLVAAVAILLSFPAVWLRGAARAGDPNHVYAVLGWLQNAVLLAVDAFLAVVLASAYLQLIQNERGVLQGEVAEVFA